VALVGGAVVLGGGASLLLGHLLSGLLFGVEPVDPTSMAVSAAVLGTVALAAALWPALRATRVDPARVLTSE
jgi:ABC-type antimicrobial peptide transport system permease subunit